MNSSKVLEIRWVTTTCFAEGKADRNKKRDRSVSVTQPDSVGVHHGGFWSRRPRFESESGYSYLCFKITVMRNFAPK